MEKLFYPESIVIFGLSSKTSNLPRLTLENLLNWGYEGRIFGINPRSQDNHVNGIKIYNNVKELPKVPDIAFCLVPARLIPDIVEECGKFGIKRVAIPSAGFSEFNKEGKELSNKIKNILDKYGISLVGPNSITVANTASGLCLPFILLRKPPEGKISIISQSGGVAIYMFNYLEEENIGLAKFASIGNKLDLDEVDFLEYFGKDPKTEIIYLYLESLNRGKEFVKTAKKIDKPILVYKSNTTAAGEKLAMSHTAAISNDEDIINSAFEEAGIIRLENYLDFIEVAKAFHLPPMKGRRVMVMSPAGGFSVLAADQCEKAGFEFANMEKDFFENLKRTNNTNVINYSNPFDMGDIYDPNLITNIFYSVMHSEQVDGAIYITQRPDMPDGNSMFHDLYLTDLSNEIQGAIASSGKPFGICMFGPTKMVTKVKKLSPHPVFNSLEGLVNSLALQQKFYEKKDELKDKEIKQEEVETFPQIDRRAASKWIKRRDGDYGEEVLELLNIYGIRVATSKVAKTKSEAVQYARELGFPVVMKLVSKDALHKSEAGGIVVGVKEPQEVESNFELIRANLKNYNENARFDGVRIQEMASGGYEMFVGGKYDPSFGPVAFFGMGGIYVEVFKDLASILCPAETDLIFKQLKDLKSYTILKGFRGQPPANIDSFVDLIKRFSLLLSENPEISELDINPVKIFSHKNGVIALDARARITSK